MLSLLTALVLAQPTAAPARWELAAPVRKIWDAGRHNAFTDLLRHRDRWLCVFREAEAHVGGDGVIRVLASADGEAWESLAAVAETGVDLRDPKLSLAPDGRLMLLMGGSVYEGKTLKSRRPRVSFSDDGRAWSPPEKVLSDGEWLWRVTWRDGAAYGLSYNSDAKPDWSLKLVTSRDGRAFEPLAAFDVPGRPNEGTIRFRDDGSAVALLRRDGADKRAWVGAAAPPYRDWGWKPLPAFAGGPNFVFRPDGSAVAVARLTDGKARTSVCRFDPAAATLTEEFTLPSGGDTSYAGLALHGGELWVSYYSSHEGKSAIYLARVRAR